MVSTQFPSQIARYWCTLSIFRYQHDSGRLRPTETGRTADVGENYSANGRLQKVSH